MHDRLIVSISCAFLAMGLASCSIDPPPSGSFLCNQTGGKVCPDGYYCAFDGRCWKSGEMPDLAAAPLDASTADTSTCVDDGTACKSRECGTAKNNCGEIVECGTCTAPATCGGGGTPGRCGCTPTTCTAENKNCGQIPDGCGHMLECGTCPQGLSCGSGDAGSPNVCGCPSGDACDDGNPCTRDDACSADHCVGVSYTCPAPSACQSAVACDGKGGCIVTHKADGTACDDGNPCTKNDVCAAGTCGGTAYVCPAPNQCQTAVACDGKGGCVVTNQTDGIACNDGNSCTKTDTCQAGVCQGTVACPCSAYPIQENGADICTASYPDNFIPYTSPSIYMASPAGCGGTASAVGIGDTSFPQAIFKNTTAANIQIGDPITVTYTGWASGSTGAIQVAVSVSPDGTSFSPCGTAAAADYLGGALRKVTCAAPFAAQSLFVKLQTVTLSSALIYLRTLQADLSATCPAPCSAYPIQESGADICTASYPDNFIPYTSPSIYMASPAGCGGTASAVGIGYTSFPQAIFKNTSAANIQLGDPITVTYTGWASGSTGAIQVAVSVSPDGTSFSPCGTAAAADYLGGALRKVTCAAPFAAQSLFVKLQTVTLSSALIYLRTLQADLSATCP